MGREVREDLPFEEALRAEELRLDKSRHELYQLGSMVHGYSAGSRYASLLQPYLELFSPENFFFVLQDDLRFRVNETCKEVFEFLEIEPSIQINTSNRNPSEIGRAHV